MKRTALLALAAAAVLLPGCYFVRKTVPLDASGMEYPLHSLGNTLEEQADRTGDTISGLPEAFGRHCRYCWRNLTQDPGDL